MLIQEESWPVALDKIVLPLAKEYKVDFNKRNIIIKNKYNIIAKGVYINKLPIFTTSKIQENNSIILNTKRSTSNEEKVIVLLTPVYRNNR